MNVANGINFILDSYSPVVIAIASGNNATFRLHYFFPEPTAITVYSQRATASAHSVYIELHIICTRFDTNTQLKPIYRLLSICVIDLNNRRLKRKTRPKNVQFSQWNHFKTRVVFTIDQFMPDTFDYIVIGAGSAGAVLANRLSTDPDVSVCLIEAGPTDNTPLVSTPLGLMLLAKNPRYNWLYQSTPQPGLDSRQIPIPRGKVLGGSSAINGMVYIRGHRADYDAWANAGCSGWDFDSVLPYFKKSESNSDPTRDTQWHGTKGELSVSNLRDPNGMDQVFIDSANLLQIRNCADFNSPEPEGVGVYQVTQKKGRRHSTGAAFLTPIKDRTNLTIATDAEVTDIVIQNQKAVAVNIRRADLSTSKIHTNREIILSAGAIGSPDLLLRSGIGPANEVTAAGYKLIRNLPGVGRNLHDHVDIMVINHTKSHTPYGVSVRAAPRLIADVFKWAFHRRGMFSSNMVEAGGFIKSSPDRIRPDIQFHLIPGRKSFSGQPIEYGHGVSLHTCILDPASRGTITRTRPDGPPDIDFGLFNVEDDLHRLRRGLQTARQILAQAPFEAHGLTEFLPGSSVESEDSLDNFIRQNARTVYHPVGTCAMGVSDQSVVDPQLKVRGIDGLRVADASIMPTIVSGNTNAPTIMIAEKAADMIIQNHQSE